MPILEIHGVPKETRGTADLSRSITKSIIATPGIKGVLESEVMVSFFSQSDESKRFVYVKSWMYRRPERDESVISEMQRRIGEVILDFALDAYPEFEMLEILPPTMLDESTCVVLTR